MSESSEGFNADFSGCSESDGSTEPIVVSDLNVSYQWTISDFCEVVHSNKWKSELTSPLFQVSYYPDILFKIYLRPCVESSGGIRKYSLILKACSVSFKKMSNNNISYKFLLTSPERNIIFWKSGRWRSDISIFNLSGGMENQCDDGCQCFIPFEKINLSMCYFKPLNIVCKIMNKKPTQESTCINVFDEKLGSRILDYKRHSNQLYEMYKLENTSDCTILHRGKAFLVHKFVLMAHSLVFRELFMDQNSKESKGDCATIGEAVETKAVEMMIDYFYKAELPCNIDRREIEELLHLAVTYKIDNLKLLCESMLRF